MSLIFATFRSRQIALGTLWSLYLFMLCLLYCVPILYESHRCYWSVVLLTCSPLSVVEPRHTVSRYITSYLSSIFLKASLHQYTRFKLLDNGSIVGFKKVVSLSGNYIWSLVICPHYGGRSIIKTTFLKLRLLRSANPIDSDMEIIQLQHSWVGLWPPSLVPLAF